MVASTTVNRVEGSDRKKSRSALCRSSLCKPMRMPSAAHARAEATRGTRNARIATAKRPANAAAGFTSAGAAARAEANAISGSAAGTSSCTLERGERLDVMCVGEKVEEVQREETPARRGQPAR